MGEVDNPHGSESQGKTYGDDIEDTADCQAVEYGLQHDQILKIFRRPIRHPETKKNYFCLL
jgi:hypothetical protein